MSGRPNALLRSLDYLKRGERLADGWTEENPRSRDWEDTYRRRWAHDRIVRSTHGVNCTGSCSWQVHVKDGIVAFETQATDYPSIGPDMPEYEPRGCPRGASFSWYLYSPGRVRFPYVREELWNAYRAERAVGLDPLAAWRSVVGDPVRCRAYQGARGKGGFVRADWDGVTELIAAATVDTILRYGPDRVTGFSPIPAMSMVSYAAGTRFLSLIGGTILSFYDWYADLPPASPQVWGEQTDVPESADWYNAKYFIIWGTNLPMTRTPDAHFMVEARYNGTKVVGVSPDFAEYVKFADEWLPVKAGTDAALAMAMAHVILKEFYVERETPYFSDYAKRYTDLPYLVVLERREEAWWAGRLLNARDLGLNVAEAAWKPAMWDDLTSGPAVPNGGLGHRWDKSGKWNLKLEDAAGHRIEPRLSLLEGSDEEVVASFPSFDGGKATKFERGLPTRRLTLADGTSVLVTTVFDLMLAQAGVDRGLSGDYPADYDDPRPHTPAWQEPITGVPRAQVARVAREFAENAVRTRGRSMIALGAGTNHWYHSDLIYRTILNLVLLTGCEGVNGGGWAHYVGQEKVRPLEGFTTLAFGLDWVRPPRQQNGTSFFYFATDQFRYETPDARTPTAPWRSRFTDLHPADMNALACRLGWLPSFPQFTENPLDLVDRLRLEGAGSDDELRVRVVKEAKAGNLHFAVEDPDNPATFPRVLFVWRSNLVGASGKGHEYFLSHLLGAEGGAFAGGEGSWLPSSVRVSETPPSGKVDLLVNIDFRMTSTSLYADIVLPAATWYEKTDLSSTDMHPFVHPFNPAVSPMWESKGDWETFTTIARAFSKLAKVHLGERDDLVMAPLLHDTPGEVSQAEGQVLDWRAGECEPIPGRTFPQLTVVHRSYPDVFDQMTTLGPLTDGVTMTKGVATEGRAAVDEAVARLGVSTAPGIGKGRPDLSEAAKAAEAILLLSGATHGGRATEGWQALERVTGLSLKDIAASHEGVHYTLKDLTVQPRPALPTPVWSGIEEESRRYAPFTTNVERLIPWRTLTGRQHLYLDHEVMRSYGEGLAVYRPPLDTPPFQPGDIKAGGREGKTITVRYLTPHQKWGIHSTYADTPRMLALFRGGPTIWLSEEDAAQLGIADNAWVEVLNRNGAVVARAVVSYRLPQGVAMMYHAQDRTVGVPRSPATGLRGGTHNSVTRIIPKPTHMIGGYAQLSYGFNYYGPTGHQRDVLAWIRPLEEVDWLED